MCSQLINGRMTKASNKRVRPPPYGDKIAAMHDMSTPPAAFTLPPSLLPPPTGEEGRKAEGAGGGSRG